MLQNAFLATSAGGMLKNAIQPPVGGLQVPNLPMARGSGANSVAASASQQLSQLIAQRRAQQLGKFTG
jgi:hypothetical protein